MSFNSAESKVVTGLLTGHNTLRKHLNTMGLMDSPLCRKCGAGEETSAHVLCECEALATLRHIYLGFFFLDPEDIRGLSLGDLELLYKDRVPLTWTSKGAQRDCQGLRASGLQRIDPHLFILISDFVE
jgi:hypothetical protein